MIKLRSWTVGILAVVLVAGGFGGGVVVDRGGLLDSPVTREASTNTKEFDVFWQAWDLVKQRYVDQSSVDDTKMTYGAIEGMLDSLGDDGHTRFLSAEELSAEEDSLAGRLEGIGAQLGLVDGKPTVVAPFPGTPAQKAGLKPGDIIVRVDDQDVAGLTAAEVAKKVRGEPGTTVKLTIQHRGESTLTEVSIVRAKITVPSVSWALLPGTKVAHVLISQFSERCVDELVSAIADARKAGATSLILDLRDNPGGIRDQAVSVASQFVGQGNVLLEQNAKGERTALSVKSGGTALDMPMVVLINEGTASAAEIVAGCLQDYGRAPMIGMTTTGTGTVLETFDLDDGSAVLLGTRQWLTPAGRQIWHQGITPDIKVELSSTVVPLIPSEESEMTPEQLQTSQDAQLLRALQEVTRQ